MPYCNRVSRTIPAAQAALVAEQSEGFQLARPAQRSHVQGAQPCGGDEVHYGLLCRIVVSGDEDVQWPAGHLS